MSARALIFIFFALFWAFKAEEYDPRRFAIHEDQISFTEKLPRLIREALCLGCFFLALFFLFQA